MAPPPVEFPYAPASTPCHNESANRRMKQPREAEFRFQSSQSGERIGTLPSPTCLTRYLDRLVPEVLFSRSGTADKSNWAGRPLGQSLLHPAQLKPIPSPPGYWSPF